MVHGVSESPNKRLLLHDLSQAQTTHVKKCLIRLTSIMVGSHQTHHTNSSTPGWLIRQSEHAEALNTADSNNICRKIYPNGMEKDNRGHWIRLYRFILRG